GGARSTPADMARFARALLDGSGPGMDALTPRWDIVQGAQQQIGYAWQTQRYKGHLVTFKTGLTGGFTSKIALDRDSDRAVIVLTLKVQMTSRSRHDRFSWQAAIREPSPRWPRSSATPKLPAPPDHLAVIPPDWRVVPAGTTLFRVYRRAGPHPGTWNSFRFYGPLNSRFDPHELPRSTQQRGVLYGATHPGAALAEFFQTRRTINVRHRQP